MFAKLARHFRTMADSHYADAMRFTRGADIHEWHFSECNRYARAASYLESRDYRLDEPEPDYADVRPHNYFQLARMA